MENLFNEDGLVLSAAYAETMEKSVLPFLKERETDLTVDSFDAKPLFVSLFDAGKDARGTVFVVHGFTENAVKYSEIIYSLLRSGFSVVAYDQRGHGRSWRDERISDLSLTHVARFSDYVKDLDCVCKSVRDRMPKPWRVFAHSMGGAVTLLFLMKHKDVFDRAVLCAPMVAVNRRGIPYFTGRLICRAFKLLGKGRQRIFYSRPYSQRESFERACATGRERFEWYNEIKHTHPEFQNNGASYSWVLASLGVSQKLLLPGRGKKIACPVMLYSAGDDWEVMSGAQAMLIKRLKQGKIKTVQGARHEIYRSDDETLFPWWHEVLAFLS